MTASRRSVSRRGRSRRVLCSVPALADGWLFEGKGGCFLEAVGGPLAGGGVPTLRAPAKPRRVEEAGFEPELHDIIIGGAAMRADCACQSCSSLGPPLDCGDRGEAGEGVLRTEAQVMAERQRFSERLVGGRAVVAQERGQPDVAERVRPPGGLLRVPGQGDLAIEVHGRLGIAALSPGGDDRNAVQRVQVVFVAHAGQQRRCLVDARTPLVGAVRREALAPRRPSRSSMRHPMPARS